MSEVVNVQPPSRVLLCRSLLSTKCSSLSFFLSSQNAIGGNPSPRWKTLRDELKCHGRYSCFFADGKKQWLPGMKISCSYEACSLLRDANLLRTHVAQMFLRVFLKSE